MGFYVSRQAYYYSGSKVVEIETNGLDYSGPDAFAVSFRHLGEGQEFDDPRDAVKAAIAIRDEWKKTDPDVAGITFGTGGGMGMEQEPFEGTDEELIALADERYESFPKCDHCGDVLGKQTYCIHDHGLDDDRFCSENCADRVIEAMQEDDAAIAAEEADA